MAWPGTPGGAGSPHWGDNVRLYVWAAIQAGQTMHWGPHANSVLDAGNVWSSGGPGPGPAPPTGTLWVDLSCDVLDLETHLGATSMSPPANSADAGTCSLTLYDPTRKYDPLNPDSPYMYGGRSRLGADTDLHVFAETLATPSTVDRWPLFTGTVDLWKEDWSAYPERRRAQVVASDAVKTLVRLDWGEQSPVGAGDNQAARITRILDYYGWTGGRAIDPSTLQYAATTLAQSAWELLGRTVGDGNGYLFVDGNGTVTTSAESRWTDHAPALVLEVGCAGAGGGVYEIAKNVQVGTSAITNSVSAARSGGTMSRYLNPTSVGLYGEHGYKRTDLVLYADADVSRYANSILATRAFPRGQLTSVTVRPQLDPASWPAVFANQANLSKEHMRVLWAPPDGGAAYDVRGRPFGATHQVTHREWEITYPLAYADVYSRVMHWGPHAYDRLDAGNVYV